MWRPLKISPAALAPNAGFVIETKPGDKDGDGYLDPMTSVNENWNGF
jgi:hypothetical protein